MTKTNRLRAQTDCGFAPTDKSNHLYDEFMRGNPDLSLHGRSIDDLIARFMKLHNVPGLTLAIVQAPYIPRVASYGVANTDKVLKGEMLASNNTLWNAALVSQGYVAVAIFQLYEAGKLDIKDPASKYVKNLPREWKHITIMDLLQHATGIADYTKTADYDHTKSYTADALIKMVASTPLAFETGTQVARSATDFLILALVIEKASKTSYENFVTTGQFERLGLRHTMFLSQRAQRTQEEDLNANHLRHSTFTKDPKFIHPSEVAIGYKSDSKGNLQTASNVPVGSYALRGYADIWASAEDISIWDMGLAGEILVKDPAHRALIYKPTKLKNGTIVPAMAGWSFTKHPGFLDIGGSAPGFSSYLSRFTAKRDLLCVTLMTNKEGVDLSHLARMIAGAYEKSLVTVAPKNMYIQESSLDVAQTIARIKAFLQAKNIPVFADFDHAKNAQEVALPLAPTQVIVFGSPKVGTLLMQLNPAIALELPLRIVVWQDAEGRTWAGFKDMRKMAEKYNVDESPVVGKIQMLLETILSKACTLMENVK